MTQATDTIHPNDIAVIGWQIKFPGADTIEEFWQNLRNGVESITYATKEELVSAGYSKEEVDLPNFVRAGSLLKDIERFDADFFGFSPRDAEIIDPQMRLFLELAWAALENAGYDPENVTGRIGVFGGTNISRYYSFNLLPAMRTTPPMVDGGMMTQCFNDKDALATLVSYKLNLRGPSVNVQSFCSTSLVAIHLACQSLRLGESDMVLAGGTNINGQGASGYLHSEGDILSPDGHCRTFDKDGRGTIFGSGAGIVVLKRLADAQRDGDTIQGIIKGSAINNDGANKAGYTAPSIDGQADAISLALQNAKVSPETISYIEAHGTATNIGDPIEVKALTQAYRQHTERKNYCAIGSVKTNLGHLDRAAGMPSFIKTLLAAKHKQIPPTVHFKEANPKIDFENSPFYVSEKLTDWTTDTDTPRRAGISALGFGGTNAHVIIEEAPVLLATTEDSSTSATPQLLVLSARTETALASMKHNLANYLQKQTSPQLENIAFTLQQGRRSFPYREAIVCQNSEDAIDALEGIKPDWVVPQSEHTSGQLEAVFMFSGQGTQYVNMGRELYATEAVFKNAVDQCASLLQDILGHDLRKLLYPETEDTEQATSALKQTAITQPALFTIEYAMARQLISWGIQPAAMIGHSIGEYTAACIAGVFSLEDALKLVSIRGKLMQSCQSGDMLAVGLSEADLLTYLNPRVSLAAINSEGLCVLSGDSASITELQQTLIAKDILARPLETSHAFHSVMMDGILQEFEAAFSEVSLKEPTIKYASNVTGKWIQPEEATSPRYWVRHLRGTVRFAQGLATLAENQNSIFLEVGPGKSLATFADRAHVLPAAKKAITTIRHPKDPQRDQPFLYKSIARLWTAGVPFDWELFNPSHSKSRIPLPTYPFERKVYWVDRPDEAAAPSLAANPGMKKADLDDWLYIPSWKRTYIELSQSKPKSGDTWLLFLDEGEKHQALASYFAKQACTTITVSAAETFRELTPLTYEMPLGDQNAYEALFKKLRAQDQLPSKILHAANFQKIASANIDASLDTGFYSLLYLAQALGNCDLKETIQLGVITDQLHSVTGESIIAPERAALLGPCKVIGKEYALLNAKNIDLSPETDPSWIQSIITELSANKADPVVAWRGRHRWVQSYEPASAATSTTKSLLKTSDCCLITGGFGGIGKVVAEHLAKTYQAKLALTTRSQLPPVADWDTWLRTHEASDSCSKKIEYVRQLEALGAQVMVLSANAVSESDMQTAVDQIEAKFGAIHGVFHTAGLPGGGIVQLKTHEVAHKVIEPKIHGTLILHKILADKSPKFVLLFSSVASVIGPFGQVDYAAANSFMDLFAQSCNQASSDTLWSATNWDDWAEVGMAVETSHDLGAENAKVSAKIEQIENHTLFQFVEKNETSKTYVSELSTDSHWIVNEHILFDKPTLPGSAYLEFARAAYALESGQAQASIGSVYIMSTFPVEKGNSRKLYTKLVPTEHGYTFHIKSRSLTDDTWTEHVTGTVSSVTAEPQAHDLEKHKAACQDEYQTGYAVEDFSFIKAGPHLELGPRWHNTREAWICPQKVFSRHALHHSITGDVTDYPLNPAYTDFTALLPFDPAGVYVPFSYKKVHVFEPLETEIYISVEVLDDVKSGNETLRFNACFLNAEGAELARIEELTLRRVDKAGPVTTAKEGPMTLSLGTSGLLDTLQFKPIEKAPPLSGQVEIEVVASGLNFRDVLRGLGMLSAEHDAGADLVGFGTECSGIITAVGEGVTKLSVGDEVLALSPFGFSTHLNVPQQAVARIPEGLSFEQAASIPLIFLTVHHGLHKTARLQKDERLLIHAATGGIGLASIQYAKYAGAEVFATAGSQRKQDYLRNLGIEHITTSRDLAFADDILKWTNEEGVDVVFNSLADEFLTKSLDLLRPFGRFIEIGAKDIYQNSPIGLRAFSKGLTFSAFDLGQISMRQPEYLSSLLEEVMAWFESGSYQALPVEIFNRDEIAEAFQHMAAAKHIGKVVITLNPQTRKQTASTSTTISTTATSNSGRDLSHAILPSEGIQIIERVLAAHHSQIVVSTRELQPMIDAHAQIAHQQNQSSNSEKPTQTRKRHPRPSLTVPYLEPRNEAESQLAEIWQALLGLEMVGVNDNFFELGGDSLIGVQLISKIRDAFTIEVSIANLYEDPTISAFAKIVAPETAVADEADTLTTADSPKDISESRRARRRRK